MKNILYSSFHPQCPVTETVAVCSSHKLNICNMLYLYPIVPGPPRLKLLACVLTASYSGGFGRELELSILQLLCCFLLTDLCIILLWALSCIVCWITHMAAFKREVLQQSFSLDYNGCLEQRNCIDICNMFTLVALDNKIFTHYKYWFVCVCEWSLCKDRSGLLVSVVAIFIWNLSCMNSII